MDELEAIRKKKLEELKRRFLKKETVKASPVHVSDKDFESLITKNRFVVVDFWAPWCGPCHMIAPIVEALAKKYAGKVVFAKMNVDENPATPTRFGIMGIPTLIFFKEGKPWKKVVGVRPLEELDLLVRKMVEDE